MPDNAEELVKKRKKERLLLKQKTMMEIQTGARQPIVQRSIGSALCLQNDDGDPFKVRGSYGNTYHDDIDPDYQPEPKPKTKEEIEFEEKINALRMSASLVEKDELTIINYKLSDYDEEAEERKAQIREKMLAEQRKREIIEEKRLRKVIYVIFFSSTK